MSALGWCIAIAAALLLAFFVSRVLRRLSADLEANELTSERIDEGQPR